MTGRTLTVGSCFAGIGGLDLGLEAAGGFRTIWHSEIKPAPSRVMAHRFPWSQPHGSITELLTGLWTPDPVDLMAGGPPCQDVSIGNAWGRKGLAGAKSGLFHAYADTIEALSPTWIVMEQVTGLLTSGVTPGADYATVLATFKELGYAIAPIIVNSLAYVPQTRERLILVGHRDADAAARAVLPLASDGGRHPDEGRPTRRTPPGEDGPGTHVYRKSRRPASELNGETWVPADYSPTLTLNDVGVSRATVIVLDSDGRPRVLTPEEWEACHGFPRGWTEAAGSDVDRWNTLGNTVTPTMAQRIGDGIRDVEGDLAPPEEDVA